jgi:hypothetical protein
MAAACVMKPKTHTADRSVLQGFCTSTVRIDRAKSVRIEDEIARRGGLGLKRFGKELIGPCPRCGGTDRFGANIAKQVFNCRGCNACGKVINLAMHVDGCDFKTAIQTLADDIDRKPIAPAITRPPPDPDDDNKNSERAERIWREAVPIAGTLAERYLHERRYLYDLPGDDVIRFHGRCTFGVGQRHSCLIGLYRNIRTNAPQAIVRTALLPDGSDKIDRLGLGPCGGAAVKIDADENVHAGLVIGEGLESCLAARQRYGLRPAWSLGSAGAIAKFEVLSGVTSLTLLVDNDGPHGTGPRATTECWNRWTAAGREVRAYTSSELGCDIADIVEFEAVVANNNE